MARNVTIHGDELYHFGIKGQKWGVRRYQNEDGTLTEAGKKRYRYNSDDGSIKILNYPEGLISRALFYEPIWKENHARWMAADKTFVKDVTDEITKYVKDKDSQRTYLETMAQNHPWKMAEIKGRFVLPGKFDSGEKLEEKRALSKLSDESRKRYDESCRANLKKSKYSSEFYKKDALSHPNEGPSNNATRRLWQDAKYQDLLKKRLVCEVELVKSQMKDFGFYSDDYSACIILGSYFKNRYNDYIK